MKQHPFTSWLFVACLKAHRRPWFAYEVARTMYDDDRLTTRQKVVAQA